MNRAGPLNVLVLYRHEDPTRMNSSLQDHLRVLELVPERARVMYANAFVPIPRLVRRTRFDAIVLHTTFLTMRWHNQFALFLWDNRWVAEHPAPKVAMPQDEYDRSEVLDEWLTAWDVSVVFSNFGEQYRKLLYPLTSRRARFETCFTGYIGDDMVAQASRTARPLVERPLDIVYRARDLPYSFGSHGVLKTEVARIVADAARRRGLSTDISTRLEDTIVGTAWFDFIAGSRSVIGVESGSSVLDRRGEIHSAVLKRTTTQPGLTFEEVSEQLPAGWDSCEFFTLGPRHFEAVVSRTVQLLVEGAYEGVLIPERHYIPLKRDWSNLDEALDQLGDLAALQVLVDRAYEEICSSEQYTYRRFAGRIADAVARSREEHRPAARARRTPLPAATHNSVGRATERIRWMRESGRRRMAESVVVAAFVQLVGSPGAATSVRFAVRMLGVSQVARALLTSLRSTHDGNRLSADMVRLALIAAARGGSGTVNFFVDASLEDDLLIFRTVTEPSHADDDEVRNAVLDGRVRRVRWDNTLLGQDVTLPASVPLTVRLDSSGCWLFVALAEALGQGSDDARALLAAAATPRTARGSTGR